MKLTCTTYKNKNVELKQADGTVYMDNVALKDIKKTYFFPCDLSHGDAHLVIHFGTAPKKDGKKVYFFRRNWLNKPITKRRNHDDDELTVKELNSAIDEFILQGEGYTHCSIGQQIGFEGRIDKTFDLSKIYATNDVIISPQGKLFMEMKNIDAVFLERLTSYTRSFDLTFVYGDSKLSISTIQRKQYLKLIKEIFAKKGCFETGPDPLPWNDMFKRKKADNLSWKEIHDILTNVEDVTEDESSEWEAGNTDDEEEDEEYDYPDEDEFDEDELKDDIYETESDDDDILDDSDYDEWESKTKRKRSDKEQGEKNKKIKI